MKRLKKFFFWLHLILGVAGGLVIAAIALTGATYAFEPQLSARFEPLSQVVAPVADAPRLPAQALLDRAAARLPGHALANLVLYADPAKPAYVQTADRHRLYLHQQTGEIVVERSPWNIFTAAIFIHTQLASGDFGHWVIILSNSFFVLLCFTGLYLWWPKHWRLSTLRAIARPDFRLSGKALNWNLHNAFGIWSVAILTVISFTGLMMSFDWASNLPFTLTGRPAPEEPPVVRFEKGATLFPINAVVADITSRNTNWETVSINFPNPKTGVYRAQLRENGAPNLSARSILYLHGRTGAVLRWEPYAEFSTVRKLRTYVLPLHMGTVAGVFGRAVNFTACLAALFLVYTGYALAWKRFSTWSKRRASATAPAATPIDLNRVPAGHANPAPVLSSSSTVAHVSH